MYHKSYIAGDSLRGCTYCETTILMAFALKLLNTKSGVHYLRGSGQCIQT